MDKASFVGFAKLSANESKTKEITDRIDRYAKEIEEFDPILAKIYKKQCIVFQEIRDYCKNKLEGK